jgi:hypothetical protein
VIDGATIVAPGKTVALWEAMLRKGTLSREEISAEGARPL